MAYYVPPHGMHAMQGVQGIQGIPGLVQVPQMVAAGQMQVGQGGLAAHQMLGAASPHHQLHMLPQQHLQAHLQPGLMSAPRVVPVAQAQLQHMMAVSQYQQAQQAHYQQAIRQQSLQRAITTVASAPRPSVLTPKTPPILRVLTVDAEVQTPECDPNPEADSSTKARIVTPTLACCSTVISSEYRQLQTRILTWGEQNERQALEVTRVKADVSPSDSLPVPATTASVVIMDDGQLKLNVCGKVIQSSAIVDKEESQLEDHLREYLDMLGDGYSFCNGLSDEDLQEVGPFAVVKCNNLIQRQAPISAAFAITCSRWCKIAEESQDRVQCEACRRAHAKLKENIDPNSDKASVSAGKRPAPVSLDDLPTQPCAKRPRLLEVTTAKGQLDMLCEQISTLHGTEINQDDMKKLLEGLENDLQQIRGLYQEGGDEEEAMQQDVQEEEVENNEAQSSSIPENTELPAEEKKEDNVVEETEEAILTTESAAEEVTEEIDEDALLNGTESNVEEEEHKQEEVEENDSTTTITTPVDAVDIVLKSDSKEVGVVENVVQEEAIEQVTQVVEVNGDSGEQN